MSSARLQATTSLVTLVQTPLDQSFTMDAETTESLCQLRGSRLPDYRTKRPKAEVPLPSPTADLGENAVITINVGKSGSLNIWDSREAIYVRRIYRTQGVLTGCYSKVPMQETFLTLPLQLMPEEAAYLRDKKLARFVSEEEFTKLPRLQDGQDFQLLREEQYRQQLELFDKFRQGHMEVHREHLLDIHASFLKHYLEKENLAMPEDCDKLWEVLREHLRSQPVDESKMVFNMELPTRSWRAALGLITLKEIEFLYPSDDYERMMYTAYETLMDNGFTVTSGSNYGVDYLAFKGDPHVVYSSYMVKVQMERSGSSLDDYLRLGRVATTAKKSLLWMAVAEDFSVRFCCNKWAVMK